MSADHFPKILGTATLNDKGQLVIPVEARNSLGLKPGSKVVLMSSPNRPALIVIKAEEVEAMMQNLADVLDNYNKEKDNKQQTMEKHIGQR